MAMMMGRTSGPVYHCLVRRFLRWGLWLLPLGAVGLMLAQPLVDATAFIIRAADVPGAPARLAEWRSAGMGPQETLQIPTRRGAIDGRLYLPRTAADRTVVLIPGVHRDGINEQRLVRLAGDLVETGFRVVTIAAPDLQKFRITPDATDVIVMLVGNKDGIKGFGRNTKTTKAPHCLGNTETAIKKDPRAPGLHQQTVALAAAAERCKTDHCKGLQKKARHRRQPGACNCAGKLTSTDQKAGSVCDWRYRTFHVCRLY